MNEKKLLVMYVAGGSSRTSKPEATRKAATSRVAGAKT
jgi:hypothetical protein